MSDYEDMTIWLGELAVVRGQVDSIGEAIRDQKLPRAIGLMRVTAETLRELAGRVQHDFRCHGVTTSGERRVLEGRR